MRLLTKQVVGYIDAEHVACFVKRASSTTAPMTVDPIAEEALRFPAAGAGQALPFVDLAFSLYLFIASLHEAVQEQDIRDLFFFSREGQFLKEMFDYFQTRNPDRVSVKSHYLEVSRRSSFLLSLGPLEDETFDVLFRQYRRISLEAFLRSLALEDHVQELASELKIDAAVFGRVSEDLPEDPLFRRLRSARLFHDLYERERSARTAAFARYVASFTGGRLPEVLHVVDVGWKGSIQDNVFNWLKRMCGEKARVYGYYVGLVAPGAMTEHNRKTGLLFSNRAGLTPGFRIFNENRSLFEVLLPACHGAPASYVVTDQGQPVVLRDSFVEQEMIERDVMPVAVEVMNRFRRIADILAKTPMSRERLFALTCSRHGRIVFRPSAAEIQWMRSVSHVENFGVFNESRFCAGEGGASFPSRIRFTARVVLNVLRKRSNDIGFWPYLTFRLRALYGVDGLYRRFRIWQESQGIKN